MRYKQIMKNYLNFETEIKNLENELEKLWKAPGKFVLTSRKLLTKMAALSLLPFAP